MGFRLAVLLGGLGNGVLIQLLLACCLLHLLDCHLGFQCAYLRIQLRLRWQHLFLLQVQIGHDVRVGYGLREGEVNGIVIVLERVLELQGVVVEDLSLLGLVLLGGISGVRGIA